MAGPSRIGLLFREARRRGVLRIAGLYIVGAWSLMQVADILLPAWDLPDSAIRYVLLAVVLGFPVALVFGWTYDVTSEGVVRTRPATAAELEAPAGLKSIDFVVLVALLVVVAAIVYTAAHNIASTPREGARLSPRLPDSVAVLPFRPLGPGQEDAPLGYGVAEEVLNRLAAIRSLTVVARTSAFPFGESSLDPVDVARRLGVSYLLQGNLQREEGMIRIRARLIDESGRQLWSRSFDRPVQGLFELQDEIARAVVTSVAPQFEAMLQGRAPPDPEAYELFILGREHMRGRKAGWREQATGAFQEAISLDPGFADPYGGLAMTHALSMEDPLAPDSASRALANAGKALALDPGLAEAHAATGLVLHITEGPEAAEAPLRRALELDPNLIEAYNWLQIALQEQGRMAESTALLKEALRLDPLDPVLNQNLAVRFVNQGRYEEAHKRYLRMLDAPDPGAQPYFSLGDLETEFGHLEAALDWNKQAVLAWREPGAINAIVQSYVDLGMHAEAERWVELVEASGARPGTKLGLRGEWQIRVGRFEEALAGFEAYLRLREREISGLPISLRQIGGALLVLAGRREEGIAVLDAVFGDPVFIPAASGGGTEGANFALIMAYGMQLSGQETEADRVLAQVHDWLRGLRAAGSAGDPSAYALEAKIHAMEGNNADALESLRRAVGLGWRRYFAELENPCWGSLREEPGYRALISIVEDDVEAQRRRVEAAGRDAAFASEVRSILGL